ncbi:MAG: hypothetical protein SOY64_07415 [Pyramidobacter sp.]|nr:hypothetical protein [Pyramidobacter sp.]
MEIFYSKFPPLHGGVMELCRELPVRRQDLERCGRIRDDGIERFPSAFGAGEPERAAYEKL